MTLDFLGATEEVTGSKFMLTTKKGVKILLDCGMYQGKGLETDKMNRDLGFDPKEVDFLLLSHAHIDHSGLIPYIYKLGFRGKVFCTPATRDLCIEADTITEETLFVEDLGADSLDFFEIITAIEETFDITIPDDAASGIATVGDAAAAIRKAIQ